MVRRWSKLMRGTFSLEADLPVLSDHTHIPKSPSGIFEGRIPRSHGLGSIWALMQQQAVACLVVEDAWLVAWAMHVKPILQSTTCPVG